jgi:hypothetical protein
MAENEVSSKSCVFMANNLEQEHAYLFSFLAGRQINLQLALRGPNLPASLEACKLRQGTGHRRNYFELCFILSKMSV